MKKSFMTRVLAVSLSAAMAFSLPSANLMTASAAATVGIAKTATVKVGNTKTLKLKKNNSDWKITKVATNKKKVCTTKKKNNKAFTIKGVKKGTATISVTIQSPSRKAAKKAKSKYQKVLKTKVTVKPKTTTPTDPTTVTDPTDATTPTGATDPTGATTPTGTTDPTTPVDGDLALTTVKSLARTTVEVVFNQKVDSVSKDNFKIAEDVAEGATAAEVAVEDAILSENGLVATLTLANSAKLGQDYVMTATGLACGGKVQGALTGKFTSLTTEDQYVAVMESDATYLKADNSSNTQVRFKIYDGTGKLCEDLNGVEVKFSTTRGSVGGQSVAVRNGVATVMFTSENLTSNATAVITGEVVTALGHGDILGLKSTTSILLTPNPGEIDAQQGAMVTHMTVQTADRIIAYFNKEVKAEEFLNSDGKLNANKVEIEVKDGVNYANGCEVATILQGDASTGSEPNKTLQILMAKPLRDNSEIKMTFKDKRYNVATSNTVYDRLVDATQPAVYNVEAVNKAGKPSMRMLKVTFSEAVLPGTLADNDKKSYAADLADNYRISGQKLNEFSKNAKVEISDKAAERNIVYITLGKDDNGKPVYFKGNNLYSLQASDIGDWAANTDGKMNVIHTQTFYFNVADNKDEPAGTVTVQSPEQWLVKFNGDIAVAKGNDKVVNQPVKDLSPDDLKSLLTDKEPLIRLEMYNATRNDFELVQTKVADAPNGSEINPITIRKTSVDGEYIVELTEDWTYIFDTELTGDNYYKNHRFQLKVDKNRLFNYENGQENSKDIVMSLTDNTATGYEKMLSPDNTSPEVIDCVPVGKYYHVQINEPVQLRANVADPYDNKMDGRIFTPSQNQMRVSNGIPQPTARFYNTETKETVLGKIENWLYEDDTWIRISPEKALSAGKWEVTVTALTDDVENTISSRSFPFEQAGAVDSTGLHVVWAAVSNTPDYNRFRQGLYDPDPKKNEVPNTEGRYIFIKYSEPLSNTELGSSALVNSNYTVSGVEVPRTANVTRFIEGYSNGKADTFDSVTIDLGAEDYKKFNLKVGKPVSISIASSIKATSGNTLGDTGRITLPYKYGTNDADVTGGTGVGYQGIDKTSDDVWGNDASEFAGGVLSDLQAALDNEKYRTIMLGTNYTIKDKETLNIKRPVTIDLAGNTLKVEGTLAASYVDTGMLKFITSKVGGKVEIAKDSNTGKETGVATVNIPNAELQIGSGVDEIFSTNKVIFGSLKIVDLSQNTFYNYGKVTNLTVTDGGGTRIMNGKGAEIANLIIDAASKMVLVNEGIMESVLVKRANSIEVRGTKDSQPIGDIVSEKSGLEVILKKADNSSQTAADLVTSTKGCDVTLGNDKVTDTDKYSKLLDDALNKLKAKDITVTSAGAANFNILAEYALPAADDSFNIGDNKTGKLEYTFTSGNTNYLTVDETTGIVAVTEAGQKLTSATSVKVTVKMTLTVKDSKQQYVKIEREASLTLTIKKG